MNLGSKILVAGCFKVECNDDKTAYKLYIDNELGPPFINCFFAGERSIENDDFYNIFCEDPAKICKKQTSCPNDCHFR